MFGTNFSGIPFRYQRFRGHRAGLVFAVVLAGTISMAQAQPDGVPLQRKAAAALAQKEYPQAIALYRKWLASNPSSEAGAIGLARAYREVYNYDEARKVLKTAAAKHPNSGTALIEIGKLDIHLKHYDDAIVDLKQAVQRQNSVDAHVYLGVAYQSGGDLKQAKLQLEDAVRKDPRSASAYYFRGALYAEMEDNQRAYADARKSHELDAMAVPASILLAKTAIRTGHCAEAVGILKPMAEAAGADIENVYLLSRAYQCADQPELAKRTQDEFERRSRAAEAARNQTMDADHLAAQADEFAKKNQLAPAMELLNRALEEDPANGPAHAMLAKIEFSRGDIAKAKNEIDTALQGSPFNPDYLYVLGKVLAKQGDTRGALAAFEEAVLVDPKESDAYFEMAQIYALQGDRARAVEEMKMAVKLSPDDIDYKQALAAMQKQR
jgi:tetratricopeptide (TPR) repeat protein